MQKDLHGQTFNTSDNCAIAYTVQPANAPVAQRLVLIHSLALDSSIWDGVASIRLPGTRAIGTCRRAVYHRIVRE
jgi:hypothetical protein